MTVTTTTTDTDLAAPLPAPTATDAEVITAVLSGNAAAFELLMRRYNRVLFRIARGIANCDEDAMDIVQECYVRAYFRLAQFEGPKGFLSWMSRIVVNEAISRSRKRKITVSSDIDTEDVATGERQRPDRIAMGEDALELIESAIDTLPPNFRVVFMLRAVEELTVEETADYLGIKPATVKTRFHRARAQLRKTLSRRIIDAVPGSFSFAGQRCDAIVHTVFTRISGLPIGRS